MLEGLVWQSCRQRRESPGSFAVASAKRLHLRGRLQDPPRPAPARPCWPSALPPGAAWRPEVGIGPRRCCDAALHVAGESCGLCPCRFLIRRLTSVRWLSCSNVEHRFCCVTVMVSFRWFKFRDLALAFGKSIQLRLLCSWAMLLCRFGCFCAVCWAAMLPLSTSAGPATCEGSWNCLENCQRSRRQSSSAQHPRVWMHGQSLILPRSHVKDTHPRNLLPH